MKQLALILLCICCLLLTVQAAERKREGGPLEENPTKKQRIEQPSPEASEVEDINIEPTEELQTTPKTTLLSGVCDLTGDFLKGTWPLDVFLQYRLKSSLLASWFRFPNFYVGPENGKFVAYEEEPAILDFMKVSSRIVRTPQGLSRVELVTRLKNLIPQVGMRLPCLNKASAKLDLETFSHQVTLQNTRGEYYTLPPEIWLAILGVPISESDLAALDELEGDSIGREDLVTLIETNPPLKKAVISIAWFLLQKHFPRLAHCDCGSLGEKLLMAKAVSREIRSMREFLETTEEVFPDENDPHHQKATMIGEHLASACPAWKEVYSEEFRIDRLVMRAAGQALTGKDMLDDKDTVLALLNAAFGIPAEQ